MSPRKGKGVSVLDVDHRHLSFTHPAKARILVKEGRAEVFSTDPFIVKLKGERRVSEMKRFATVTKSFVEYFKTERDVYVQNLSNTQVSLQFGIMPNITSVLIPETRKPFNLSQHVPFKDLRDSSDLRKMLNRRPPTLVLLEQEDFESFYDDLAAKKGTTPDEEIAQAYEEQLALMQRRPLPLKDDELTKPPADEPEEPKIEEPEETVKPRIVGMCADEDLKAGDFIEKLDMIKDELTRADLEYLQGNAPFKTVQKWAVKNLS